MSYLTYSYSNLRSFAHDLVRFNLKPLIIVTIIYFALAIFFDDYIVITTILSSISIILITTICTFSLTSKKYGFDTFVNGSKQLLIASSKYLLVDILITLFFSLIEYIFTIFVESLNGSNQFLLVLTAGIIIIILIAYISIRISLMSTVVVMMPQLKTIEAIKYSLSLTKGRTFDIFKYTLTYFGWFLLALITLGIAVVYVMPLITAGGISYYLYVTGRPLEIN